MSKTKKSRKQVESSEDTDPLSTSEESTSESSSEDRSHSRKHRKKSRKVKKRKSKKKSVLSDEDDSTEEVRHSKRSKKSEKHKKKRKRHNSDSDVQIEEHEKVLYISSGAEGDDDRHKHYERSKRLSELKMLRGTDERHVRSKWDSPTDDREIRQRSTNNPVNKYNRGDYVSRDDEADRHSRRNDNLEFRRNNRYDDEPGHRRVESGRRDRSHEPRRHSTERQERYRDFNERRRDDRMMESEGRKEISVGRVTRNPFDRKPSEISLGELPRRDEHKREELSRRDEHKREELSRRDDHRRNEPRRDETRRDEFRRDEPRRDELRRDEPRRDEFRREEPRRDEFRRDEPRRDEFRRDEPRRDEPRRDEPRRNEFRREEPRRDEPRRDEPRRDEPRRDEPRRDELRRDEFRRDEPRRDEPRRDELRRDEPRRDEPRRDEHRSDEPRRDEPRRDEIRREERGRENRFADKNAERTVKRERDNSGGSRFEESKRHKKINTDRRSGERDVRNISDKRDGRKDYERDQPRKGSHERRRPRSSSRSPAPQKNRRFRRGSDEDHGNHEWGKKNSNDNSKQKAEPIEKEKPNFGLSGKLTEDTNKVNGVVINYAEPPEARKPKRRWRLYPFKGEQSLQTFYIHRQSCFLIGRDRKICDIPIDHPSCSKQHAVLQYRLVPYEKEDGTTSKRVRPYLLDMSSANGTFVNNNKIESRKYVELLEKDVIKFGYSSREYVLLHENSKDEDLDDDVGNEDLHIKTEGD
ncbi:hypothetical protein HA402_002832 [Bradysia odoriphaga]|nr:hypothetical protein HA402_002832 [Bradysia odoriphaga]